MTLALVTAITQIPIAGAVEPGDVVAMAATPSGKGYWILRASGQVTAAGDAAALGDFLAIGTYTALVATPTGRGIWALTEDGLVSNLGDARDLGDFASDDDDDDDPHNPCCIGLTALERTPTGRGLWALGADGQLFALGDARDFGDFASDDDDDDDDDDGGQPTGHEGRVALEATPSGRGLWALTGGGDVQILGDAPNVGHFPPAECGTPEGINVALENTPSGHGLWAVNKGGEVATLGDAPALGDFAHSCPEGVVALEGTPSGGGLWAVTEGGAIHTLGDAQLFDTCDFPCVVTEGDGALDAESEEVEGS